MKALVIGGARSGKSRIAENLALRVAQADSLPLVYLATAQAFDGEMKARIEHHRQSRRVEFQTVEEPLEIASWLRRQSQPQVVLIECLSMLVSNWMMRGMDVLAKSNELYRVLLESDQSWIAVSNEVGMGIVPADLLSRNYRDDLGRMHQHIATMADHVYLTVAGIPMDVKAWQASSLL